jgi:hypothetical protein
MTPKSKAIAVILIGYNLHNRSTEGDIIVIPESSIVTVATMDFAFKLLVSTITALTVAAPMCNS